MAITSRRKNREIRDGGTIVSTFTGADVGKSIDFMGIPEGFRVTAVNVTVDEAFANTDNKISVGIENDLVRFVPQTTVDTVKGIAFNNRQFTAEDTIAIVADIVGPDSATGKATVTVAYAKHPLSKQEY